MRLTEHRDIPKARRPLAACVRSTSERRLHRLQFAIPFTMTLVIGGVGPAFAQCTQLCLAQAADQEGLLAPFTKLLDTTAGQALLSANFQTEDYIYLNSTQVQKIAAGSVFILGLGSSEYPVLQANILLRAFPGNPRYGYDSTGLPTAPALPASVSGAVIAILDNSQVTEMKPFFGTAQIYSKAYGLLPGQIDTTDNPPPYQSSSVIQSNPFTVANSSAFAAANQQTINGYGVNWLDQPGVDSQIGDFPSAHTRLATFNAMSYAILAPGYYQQLSGSAAEFAYDLNVFGEHYPLDVVGGRILATYVLAETLAGNPLYPSTVPSNLGSLSQAMQSYLGGGGSSPYAAACAGNVAGCIAASAIPSAAAYAQMIQNYT